MTEDTSEDTTSDSASAGDVVAEAAIEPVVVESAEIEVSTQQTIEEPGKLLRIAAMTRSMLEEARDVTLDEEGRSRLRDIHGASVQQLRDVVTDDLREELSEVFLSLGGDVPSQAELRIAQAQLIGWLEGLFNGIQAAIMTQQMAAQAQLQQMRGAPIEPDDSEDHEGGGLYL